MVGRKTICTTASCENIWMHARILDRSACCVSGVRWAQIRGVGGECLREMGHFSTGWRRNADKSYLAASGQKKLQITHSSNSLLSVWLACCVALVNQSVSQPVNKGSCDCNALSALWNLGGRNVTWLQLMGRSQRHYFRRTSAGEVPITWH